MASEFTRFIVADMDGGQYEVTPQNFASCAVLASQDPAHMRLRQFVANELAPRAVGTGEAPRHIEFMRQQELVELRREPI